MRQGRPLRVALHQQHGMLPGSCIKEEDSQAKSEDHEKLHSLSVPVGLLFARQQLFPRRLEVLICPLLP